MPISTITPLAEFAEWLGQQPSDAKYNYASPVRCPIARFLLSRYCGVVVGSSFVYIGENRFKLPESWNNIVFANPWTYGDAYERALAVLSDQTAAGEVSGD